MSANLSAKATAVLDAARAYGDAAAAHDKLVRDWKRNDPMEAIRASNDATRQLEWALRSASRAYATSVRKRSPTKAEG